MGAADANASFLQGLSKHVQHPSPKFAQLVEEEHTAMRQADLAWSQ
jgi:hypothetical protein